MGFETTANFSFLSTCSCLSRRKRQTDRDRENERIREKIKKEREEGDQKAFVMYLDGVLSRTHPDT